MRCATDADTDRQGWTRIVEMPDHARTIRPWRRFGGAARADSSVRFSQEIVAAPAGVLPFSEIEVVGFLP